MSAVNDLAKTLLCLSFSNFKSKETALATFYVSAQDNALTFQKYK